MTLLGILEVGIGLAFVYLLLCVFCSAINEWLAQKVGSRGAFLRLGLRRMLGSDEIYLRLIGHPLIAPTWKERPGRGAPSYLPAQQFANALVDVVRERGRGLGDGSPLAGDLPGLVQAAERYAAAEEPIGRVLVTLLGRANGNYDAALREIEGWYDQAMDRVAGWYKAHAQKALFAIGLAAAVLFNVDSVDITLALWRSPGLRGAVVSEATRTLETGKVGDAALAQVLQRPPTEAETKAFAAALQGVQKGGLPIGFACLGPDPARADQQVLERCWADVKAGAEGRWGLKIAGWLLTALAVSLGAPFWFEVLGKLVNLRSAGPSPKPRVEAAPQDKRPQQA